jgi:predicted deacylase
MRHVVPVLVAVGLVAVGLVATAPAGAAGDAGVHEDRVLVGTSALGRPIVATHRWSDGARRTTVVLGSMHGDERAGMRVVRRLREVALPRGVDLWLVRTMNPDGAAADRRTNAHGVDLNRNFPRYWRPGDEGTTRWSGPAPASEPETQAMMTFLTEVSPRTTISFHQPLYGVDSYRAKSMPLIRRLSRLLDLPVRRFDCSGACHGTLTDWHNARLDGRAVTVELGRTATRAEVRHLARGVLTLATPR